MLGHDTLQNYFKTNFSLVQHHGYSLSEIEGMMPWERMIYITLLQNHLHIIEEQRRDQAAANKFKRR